MQVGNLSLNAADRQSVEGGRWMGGGGGAGRGSGRRSVWPVRPEARVRGKMGLRGSIIGGSWHKYNFCDVFCRNKSILATTDKTFVATKLCLVVTK